MKKIITISREFGAGGTDIASRLASDLGVEYYDKALILTAASESNVDVDSLVKWDEKVPVTFGFTQSLFDFYNKPLSQQIYEAQKKVIRKFADRGSCIIIGRNANSILKEYENTLHVFISADFNWRLERMKGKMPGVSEAKVIEGIKTADRARAKYCSYHTKTVFGAADNYDMCLSASKLGIEKCVKLIEAAID